ncbi:hypothetical protein N0V93_005713 [Gnomoniopsis smithogilvyi]|uniref:F-box domain-containing protein n=1 Tax=Gnomoniopsis smithogilvyi TaxID=1191159 RepID=A0A9W9CYE3_9PEZI|nr:hypothetical protein N0V93_005713 [Gnomoniopsis smithogilvyi]
MVKLRSKLHLRGQRRKSPFQRAFCPVECNAAVRTQSAGTPSMSGPTELPSSSLRGPTLGSLPEELLVRIASFCDLSDILRLRRSSRALHYSFGKNCVIEQVLIRLMEPSSSSSDSGRQDFLIEMIKAQLDEESRDEDFRRDVFLCLAVTIPARQRARMKGAVESLLARARIRGSCRDSGLGEDPQDLHAHHNDLDLAAQLERSIGVVSTLLVLGYSDICDLDLGRHLIVLNHWSVKSKLWTEKRLLKHKEVSLQLALAMVFGLINPADWVGVPPSPPEFLKLAQRVRADYRGSDFTFSSQSFYLSWVGLQTRSLQLAGLIAYTLKAGGLEDIPRSDLLPLLRGSILMSDRWTRHIPHPSINQQKMPLLENFSSTGIRTQPNSWQEWYTSRVRDLVNTIEDEEWYGYYVYTLGDNENPTSGGAQDPAMEHIHFKLGSRPALPSSRSQGSTATSPTTTHPSKLPLEARAGKDGVMAEFDFVGSININTGTMDLRKSYRGAHYWDYEGIMTPLGIIGEWGREGTGFDGYFWLWKRSWMVNDAVQRTHGYS